MVFADPSFACTAIPASSRTRGWRFGEPEDFVSNYWHEPKDVIWRHNDHAWIVEFTGDTDLIESVSYWAIPFENRNSLPADADLPSNRYSTLEAAGAHVFRSTDSAEPVFGRPDHNGDFVYMAIVTYGTDSGQESRSSQQLHKPMVMATVNWSNRLSKSDETLVHPRYAPTASGYHGYPGPIFYPERNLPETEEDSTLYDFVSVEVNLDPPIPAGLSAELYAQVLDPDNYVFGVYDYNDTQDTIRALDNYRGSSDYSSLSLTVGGELSSLPPIGGGYSNNKTLEVQLPGGTGFERIFFRTSEPQPGNNWQVVVHNEEAIAKTVGYQDGVLAPRRNNQHMPYQIFTPILTAVRSLFIEADEMLSPTGNTPALKRAIFNGEAGCNGCDDPLPSGTTVGSVDMNVLYGLMQPLLIHVRMLPASLNEHPNVPFQHYAGLAQVAAGVALDYRDVESERDYWVIQMVSAYKGTDDFDNDDDKPFASKSWQLGYTTNFHADGACLIYIEEIRDVVADADNTNPVDLQLNPSFLGIVSAHEAVHRFVGPHRAAIDEEIMDWEKVLLENSEIRFSPLQVKIIQSRERPK